MQKLDFVRSHAMSEFLHLTSIVKTAGESRPPPPPKGLPVGSKAVVGTVCLSDRCHSARTPPSCPDSSISSVEKCGSGPPQAKIFERKNQRYYTKKLKKTRVFPLRHLTDASSLLKSG